jgi:hypothetical protein
VRWRVLDIDWHSPAYQSHHRYRRSVAVLGCGFVSDDGVPCGGARRQDAGWPGRRRGRRARVARLRRPGGVRALGGVLATGKGCSDAVLRRDDCSNVGQLGASGWCVSSLCSAITVLSGTRVDACWPPLPSRARRLRGTLEEGVALATTPVDHRLVSGGHQPMSNAEDMAWLVFNARSLAFELRICLSPEGAFVPRPTGPLTSTTSKGVLMRRAVARQPAFAIRDRSARPFAARIVSARSPLLRRVDGQLPP